MLGICLQELRCFGVLFRLLLYVKVFKRQALL